VQVIRCKISFVNSLLPTLEGTTSTITKTEQIMPRIMRIPWKRAGDK